MTDPSELMDQRIKELGDWPQDARRTPAKRFDSGS